MSAPYIQVRVNVDSDGSFHFDPTSPGQGYQVNQHGDIRRTSELPNEGGLITFGFRPGDGIRDFEVIGMRLAAHHEDISQHPVKRDTSGEFYESTPFEVSWNQLEPHALRVTERIRAGLVPPEEGWIYSLRVRIGGLEHSVDPRIYNDGSGSGPI